MEFDAGEAHAVHAFELKQVLDAGAGLGDLQSAFEFEGFEIAPALLVGFEADLLGDLVRDEHGGRAGIEDEVKGAFAVELRPHQHVLGIGEAVGHLDGGGFLHRWVGGERRGTGEEGNEAEQPIFHGPPQKSDNAERSPIFYLFRMRQFRGSDNPLTSPAND